MTSADQTGQFHTGSSDRPAAEPSVFQGMGDPPSAGVQAEESVTEQLAAAAHPQPPEESEEPVYEEPEEDIARREKAQKTDADRVELMRLDQLSTEPADEKKAQAITKENEELQLAAHAAHLDALEVAEKENVKVEKAQEAEAKRVEKGEPEPKKAEARESRTEESKEPEDLTVPELKAELDKAGVEYPANALKDELVCMVQAQRKKADKGTTGAKTTEAKKAEPKKAEPKKADEAEEVEEVEAEELTIPELKAELDEAGVNYPSTANKADLVKLVKKTWK